MTQGVASQAAHENGVAANDTDKRHIHILIAGAGLTGLILAQGINKFNASPEAATHPVKLTYEIFEREPFVFYRGGGYSLTLHWGLQVLQDALPKEVLDGLDSCLCNPHFVETGQTTDFQYLNLRTKEVVVRAPMPKVPVARVARTRLIKLLMQGIDVQFSKQLSDISWPADDRVTAHFADGTSADGNLLIGADGGKSAVRRILCGPRAESQPVAVKAVGLRCHYPVEKCAKYQEIDPNIVHGGDPDTNTYFWFSLLDMPRPNSDRPLAECYITVNWPFEDDFLGKGKPTDVPATRSERIGFLRDLAEGWAEPLREMIFDLPSETDIREINLVEWTPEKGMWDNHNGTVTLIGDSAHAMTPFRGEAANHGILDAGNILDMLLGKKGSGSSDQNLEKMDLKSLITAYEDEMIERVGPAVKRSTQACLDATHFEKMRSGSFFVSNRFEKKVAEEP
ncbi:hypothetical protein S7711_09357 [Stachybotrys chartarum IBT 7711]|uniref:FAD-binding domain-containing protein n=1 Tax=Stachybotrys chartarum (strain CBS 109288 / IBT 7711) TaxID=1280523 RepID=A0A084AYK4_STACB|nr:hypothetical protein S7711_09357 [Stachybotrys chartarum IBT 7711]